MKNKKNMIHRHLFKKYWVLIASLFFLIPNEGYAARYYMKDNPNLIKGCNSTVEIVVDTEGSDVLAGDSTLFFDNRELTVNTVNVGSALPMQVFERIQNDEIKLSGARFPRTGPFNGVETFGYIHFTPDAAAVTGTLSFAPDLVVDNNLVDESITNVLVDAVSKTYTFKDKYYGGFCTPDTTPPTISWISPGSNSGGNSPDANLFFSLRDNRHDVDKDSMEITVDGVLYNSASPEVTIVQAAGVTRVEINPVNDFALSSRVPVRVSACDTNQPANCRDYNMNFNVRQPSPPPPVCGDGIITQSAGEQCDDGNNVDGDGCSVLCLLERPAAPSCNDGVHNQGEQGIDCGGPCPNACPSCVDNVLNQGEENVDCGGPCPSCQKNPPVSYITICHAPVGTSRDKAYSLSIPDNQWPTYQLNGDTMGACASFDQCAAAVLLSTPNREDEVRREASLLIESGVTDRSSSLIDLPEKPAVAIDQLAVCRTNPDFINADLDSLSHDLDGDGLSDRVECYRGTHPEKPDTDNDTCSDFDELNYYYTDPLKEGDCETKTQATGFYDVLLTDPKPGWTVVSQTPTLSGKIPLNSQLVLGVATRSEQLTLNQLISSLEDLLKLSEKNAPKVILDALNQFKESRQLATDFVEKNKDLADFDEYKKWIQSLPDRVDRDNLFVQGVRTKLEQVRFELIKLRKEPAIAMATTVFADTFVSDLTALNFEELSESLEDKAMYDLVITAYLNTGERVSSQPVRFSVDTAFSVNKPFPRTIGGESTDLSKNNALSDLIWGERVYADSSAPEGRFEIRINELRPTVTGDTDYGTNVFAVWNSVVLASSVISDSEEGAFEIQAPKKLEPDVPHRVTLYSVKEVGGHQVRSENVDVYFRIHTVSLLHIFLIILLILLILALIIYLVRKHMLNNKYKKKSLIQKNKK